MTCHCPLRLRSPRSVAAAGLLASLAVACSSGGDDFEAGPYGAVARSAAEAWPTAPAGVPVLTETQVASACIRSAECALPLFDDCAASGLCEPGDTFAHSHALAAMVGLCVHDTVHSAERAIPMSGFSQRNERAEYFVACVESATTCSAVNACLTDRLDDIHCQEDGCRVGVSTRVTCDGSRATLIVGTTRHTRDCALALAECDPESPTGCTDRPFSVCSDDLPAADRCDGDVRLGCDAGGQVSYRDCSRLGGTCGELPSGKQGCIYPERDFDCAFELDGWAVCDGDEMQTCVNGRRVGVVTELCAAARR